MNGGTSITKTRRGHKGTRITQQNVIVSHDCPHPEVTWHIEKERSYVCIKYYKTF